MKFGIEKSHLWSLHAIHEHVWSCHAKYCGCWRCVSPEHRICRSCCCVWWTVMEFSWLLTRVPRSSSEHLQWHRGWKGIAMERFGQIVSIGDTTVLYCFGFDLFWDSFNILSLTVSSRFPHKFDKFEVDLDDADVNGQGLRHSLKNQVMAACHGRTCSATSFSRSYLFTHTHI